MADHKEQLIAALTKLVNRDFAGNWQVAFSYYDRDCDGRMNEEEIFSLLAAAEIGNRLTRWAWVDGVLKALDADNDDAVTLLEFNAAIQRG